VLFVTKMRKRRPRGQTQQAGGQLRCEHCFDIVVGSWRPELGWLRVHTPEAATAMVNIANQLGFLATSLGGGYAADKLLGKRQILALSAICAAMCTGTLGLVRDFTVVLGVSLVLGAAQGLGAGCIQPLQADALPAVGSASRDMNLLVVAFTLAQILAPLACGLVLRHFVSSANQGGCSAADDGAHHGGGGSGDGSGSVGSAEQDTASHAAYEWIWLSAAVLQLASVPLLRCVRKRRPRGRARSGSQESGASLLQ
jgi:MFS family permease